MKDKLLFERSPNAMVICARDTLHLLKGNKKFCRKYHCGVIEIEKNLLTVADFFYGKDVAFLKKYFNNSNGQAEYSKKIWRQRSNKDDIFYVKIALQPLEYESNPAWLISMIDVTEEVKEREKAHRAFEELSYHMQNTPLALIRWDHKFRITEWSQRAVEISGYAREEVLGKPPTFFNFGKKEEARKVLDSMQQLLKGEKERDHLDVLFVDKANNTLSIKIHSSALRGLDGELISVLTLIEDFTEQKEAQSKLQRSEKLFKSLFTKAPQAIVMVDSKNKVQQVNKSFEALFGYDAHELLEKDLDKVLRVSNTEDEVPSMLNNGFEQGKLYSGQKRYTKEGEEQDVIVGTIPVHLNGELIAGFGIYIDITEQINIQQQLQQSLDEQQVLLEEVHHRVKNNLAVVSGLLQMQTLHVDDERLTQYIKNSQLRIQSMAIVHEMLYRSKKLSHIQMSDYVGKLTQVISEMLGPDDKTIKTVVKTESIILNINQAIPCALIISELISNAYTFAFEGLEEGIIQIALYGNEETVRVEVRDDGIGLPDNFEEMRKKSLGLSLIDNLCDQLGTRVEIDTGAWGTSFGLFFEKQDIAGSSSSNRVQ